MIDKALGSELPRSRRDVLQLAAYLRRAGHPDRRHAARSANRAGRRPSARRRRSPPSGPPATAPQPQAHPRWRGDTATSRGPRPSRAHPPKATRPPSGEASAPRPAPSSPSPAQDRGQRRLAQAHTPTDGQTRTPHQGRRPGGRGDRGGGRRRRRPDLVDQRRRATHQPTRRDARAERCRLPRRCRRRCGSCGPHPARRPARRWWSAGSVVTGDGREVDGRDPATGKTLVELRA